jgi:hypothetical protein
MILLIALITRSICSCDEASVQSGTTFGRRLPSALDHEQPDSICRQDQLWLSGTRSAEYGTSTICGFDFDGVTRKLPYPFKVYMKRISANDPISKAGLEWVKGIINSLIERIPAVIDPRVHEIINAVASRDGKAYIVSGRRASGCHRIVGFLKKYDIRVDGVLCKGNSMLSEAEFKLDCCKRLRLTAFYEDRPVVARKLARSGINVVLWE